MGRSGHILLIAVALVLPATIAPARVNQPVALTAGAEGVFQTAEEAMADDLARVARARGWSAAQASAYAKAESEIGRVAAEVAAKRPDIFVGSALSKNGDGAPTLYVKGPADAELLQLIGTASVPIQIADLQPFSFAELEARQSAVHTALRTSGYLDVATSINMTGQGQIPVHLYVPPDRPTEIERILTSIPEALRSSVDLTFSDGPIARAEGAFGGMQLNSPAGLQCTSGWTVVETNSGTRGISGAGHCDAVNAVVHPGHGNHATTFQAAHEGQWGDVEWYTTVQAEADDFYASAGVVRDVSSVEAAAAIALNEAICVYGRASNQADCTLSVSDVSIACGPLDRLVQMDGDTQIGGDSGGPWYFGNKAYGGHYGNCGARDSFSKASFFDEAIGVFVPTS